VPASPGRHLFPTIAVAFLAVSSLCAQNPPSQFDALSAQAAAARDQRNLPAALDLYSQAVQLNPAFAEGWWNIGLIDYVTGNYPPAIDAFTHLLVLQPHSAETMAIRGLCEFHTAAYDDALRDLETAVAHGAAEDPEHSEIIRYHLGVLLTHSGRSWDALQQFRILAMGHADDPGLPVAIGLAGLQMRLLPQELGAQDRELCEATGKAGFASMSGDSDTADRLFRELFARSPSTPNLHYFYGLLLFPHDRTMAAEQFRQEVRLAPANPAATASLAFALMYTGRFTEALPVAERAVALAPGLLTAQLALGRSLIETGDEKRGVELMEEVLRHDPNNIEAHLALAAADSREGRKEEAYRERMLCLALER
jgi:tetratricopeptide (TPR) repeat protein